MKYIYLIFCCSLLLFGCKDDPEVIPEGCRWCEGDEEFACVDDACECIEGERVGTRCLTGEFWYVSEESCREYDGMGLAVLKDNSEALITWGDSSTSYGIVQIPVQEGVRWQENEFRFTILDDFIRDTATVMHAHGELLSDGSIPLNLRWILIGTTRVAAECDLILQNVE